MADVGKQIKEGRHVGLDIYDLLIEAPGAHRAADQPHGLERETGRGRLQRSTIHRARVPRLERWPVVGLDPMYHWTDRKIRIHAFYCMLGISLLQYVHQQAKAGWADLSVEQLLEELEQIKQFVLLYPPQGEKGPPRTAYVLSQQSLAQQALVKTLGLAAMAS